MDSGKRPYCHRSTRPQIDALIVHGRHAATLQRAVDALGGAPRAHGVATDLANAAGAAELTRAAQKIGPVDILVNNVGYFEVKPFESISDEDWTSMFELNFMSGVRLSRALMQPMLERNCGRIVFIASEQSAKCSGRASAINGAAQRADGGIVRSLF